MWRGTDGNQSRRRLKKVHSLWKKGKKKHSRNLNEPKSAQNSHEITVNQVESMDA